MNDINIDPLRERFLFSFKNNSRESSILSKASSVPYYEQIEVQNNNTMQSEQVEAEYTSHSSNSNVEEHNISNNSETGNGPKHGKRCKVNEALALNNMLLPCEASKAIDQYVLDMQ